MVQAKHPLGDSAPAEPGAGPGTHARVGLISDRWLKPAEWSQRGLTLVRMQWLAFEWLLVDPPAAIVLDLESADARQVADVWQLHDLLGVPVVVLAGAAPRGEIQALLERGAEDVVTGSPDGTLTAALVAAILRRPRSGSVQQVPLVLRLDGIEVDMARRVVRRPGGPLSLSRTEFALLMALVRAGGRACSHAELVTRVWGADHAAATHYLRLYIRYLRQKIERDPLHPRHLLNVRGVGYRLVPGVQYDDRDGGRTPGSRAGGSPEHA
jgi:two-component system KDP operon response regulator KdpE